MKKLLRSIHHHHDHEHNHEQSLAHRHYWGQYHLADRAPHAHHNHQDRDHDGHDQVPSDSQARGQQSQTDDTNC